MYEKYSKIKDVLDIYLKNNNLSKVAYLTNTHPNEFDKKYLLEDLNYMCFCASDFKDLSYILFLKYYHGYKKIPFNVFIATVEDCLVERQYGYVFLRFTDKNAARETLKFISNNKKKINRKYPLLLRIICDEGCLIKEDMPENVALAIILDTSDSILRVV